MSIMKTSTVNINAASAMVVVDNTTKRKITIQHGTVVRTGGTSLRITFPQAFKSSPICLVTPIINANNEFSNQGAYVTTPSYFDFYSYALSHEIQALMWMAMFIESI